MNWLYSPQQQPPGPNLPSSTNLNEIPQIRSLLPQSTSFTFHGCSLNSKLELPETFPAGALFLPPTSLGRLHCLDFAARLRSLCHPVSPTFVFPTAEIVI